jgi:hypothetical protein
MHRANPVVSPRGAGATLPVRAAAPPRLQRLGAAQPVLAGQGDTSNESIH